MSLTSSVASGGASRIPGFLTPQGEQDLDKFGLNERYMDEWLRLQSEKNEGSRVRTRSAMTISPCLYFASRRSTHSDVMSVVTTTRPSVKAGKSPFNKANGTKGKRYDSTTVNQDP